MLFIQRELERIQGVLTSDERPERYEELYAAQQSLLWVLDSATFKSPHDTIVNAVRKTQEIVRQEVVVLSLQIISAIVLFDHDPDRYSLLNHKVIGRVSFDVCDCRVFVIVKAGPTHRLNAAMAVVMGGKLRYAFNMF
jgi:hypothetical protein